jgi:hypothetical protein
MKRQREAGPGGFEDRLESGDSKKVFHPPQVSSQNHHQQHQHHQQFLQLQMKEYQKEMESKQQILLQQGLAWQKQAQAQQRHQLNQRQHEWKAPSFQEHDSGWTMSSACLCFLIFVNERA